MSDVVDNFRAYKALRAMGLKPVEIVTCSCGQKNRVDVMRLVVKTRTWLDTGVGDIHKAYCGRCRAKLDI